MKIGKAKYGGTKKTYFKIKDGDNTYRIIPPIGDLADKGIWSVFFNVHYGYKNSAGQLRPFQSSLVKSRKAPYMVEVPDAALERIQKLKAELEVAKKSGNAKLVAKLNEFVGQKGQFNLDNNHYVNAIDLQGNIGILKLRHRCKTALDAVIKKLRENGVDPLDPSNGRYFTITRSGTGLDTTFQVNVYSQKINVPGVGDVSKEVSHVIDDSMISRLSSEAADLSKLFKKPTAQEIERIVAEGASAVDEILDNKSGTAVSASEGAAEEYDESGDYDELPAAPAAVAVAPLTINAGPVQVSTPTPAPVVAAPVTTTATQVNEMSDADFLKSLGL